MNAVTEMVSPLVFTDSAAGKVKELIEEEGNFSMASRLTRKSMRMMRRSRRTASHC